MIMRNEQNDKDWMNDIREDEQEDEEAKEETKSDGLRER